MGIKVRIWSDYFKPLYPIHFMYFKIVICFSRQLFYRILCCFDLHRFLFETAEQSRPVRYRGQYAILPYRERQSSCGNVYHAIKRVLYVQRLLNYLSRWDDVHNARSWSESAVEIKMVSRVFAAPHLMFST